MILITQFGHLRNNKCFFRDIFSGTGKVGLPVPEKLNNLRGDIMVKVNIGEIFINNDLFECVNRHMNNMIEHNTDLPAQLKDMNTEKEFSLFFADFLYKFSYMMTEKFKSWEDV